MQPACHAAARAQPRAGMHCGADVPDSLRLLLQANWQPVPVAARPRFSRSSVLFPAPLRHAAWRRGQAARSAPLRNAYAVGSVRLRRPLRRTALQAREKHASSPVPVGGLHRSECASGETKPQPAGTAPEVLALLCLPAFVLPPARPRADCLNFLFMSCPK